MEREADEFLWFDRHLSWSSSNLLEVLIDLNEYLKFNLLPEDVDNLEKDIFSLGLDLPLLFDVLHELDPDFFVHGLKERCKLYLC